MYLLCLLVITSVHWTQEHLTFPVNYCDLAKACVHDNRMVCATSENNCIRRTFLDQCDMYEYNCDYHAGYRQIYTQFCFGSDLIVLKPDLNPTTSKTIINCPSSCFLNTVTTSIFRSTNTKSTTTANTPSGASKITSTNSNTKIIKTNTTTTPETVTDSSTASYTITFRNTFTSNTVRSILNKKDLEKEVVNTEEINNIESFATTCEYSCGRPISWITTTATTNTLPAIHNERNSDSEEREEPTSTSSITQPTTANILPKTHPAVELLQTIHKRDPINTPISSSVVPTINKATKFSSENSLWNDTGSEYDNLVEHSTTTDSVSVPTKIDKLNYVIETTPCNDCRRPRTWITRLKSTRRLRYHGYRY